MTWDSIADFVGKLVNPESIIHVGGLTLLVLVIFAETGLLVGFFLPGDSLLFTAGLLTALGMLDTHIAWVVLSIFLAAATGDQLGYYIGYRSGPLIFKQRESWLFKPQYVTMTRSFFDKYGARALMLGHWMPIIRTFLPVLAGVARLPYPKFLLYTSIGSGLWATVLTLTGYFLGVQIPWIKEYMEYIIVGFILVTTVPVIRKFYKESQLHKAAAAREVAEATKRAEPERTPV